MAFEDRGNEKPDHLSVQMSFKNDSTLHIRANYTVGAPKNNEIYFLLNPSYRINNIAAPGLMGYELSMKRNRPFPFYRLKFEHTGPGRLEIDFDYTIDLKTQNHIKSNWLEFNVDKLWFPNHGDLDNKFSWNLNIEGLYKDYSVITYSYNGQIKHKTILRPKDVISLEQKEPNGEIFLLMAQNMKLWSKPNSAKEVNIEIFAHKNTPDSTLISLDKKLNDIIGLFNNAFGKKEKLKKYLLVIRNSNPKEIGFLQSRGDLLLANQTSNSYASLAHEAAHYWWCNADFIKEPWMNESFANYSMFIALDKFDQKMLEKQIQRSLTHSKNGMSVKNATLFPQSNFNAYYHKGSINLWNLEQQIGRKKMLLLLSKRVKNKIETTNGFLELLEKQEGKNTRREFETSM